MSGPAHVRSSESIETFRRALKKFQQRIEDALVELDGQMRRAVDWIEHDRPTYWEQQRRDAEDAIHEAKLNLERCLIYRVTDERPACREERAALKKARSRSDECRERIERVRHWKRSMNHELFEYQGRIGKLKRLLEHDIPRADSVLQNILRQLDSYQIEPAPAASDATMASLPVVAEEFDEAAKEKNA